MVTIRVADKAADAEAILTGARMFAATSGLPDVLPPLESLEFSDAVMRMIELPQSVVFLAEHNGALAGGIGMMIMPYVWNPGRLAAEELFWWSWPDRCPQAAMALLRAAKAHVVAAGVTVLSFGSLMSSPVAVDTIYRRMGMRPVGVSYLGLVA